jgi:hypothetical protein
VAAALPENGKDGHESGNSAFTGVARQSETEQLFDCRGTFLGTRRKSMR